MLKVNRSIGRVNYVNNIDFKRGIRSLRVVSERQKKVEEKHAVQNALEIVEKEKQLAEWKKQDAEKLINWTPWRRKIEDQIAAKYVPLPLSLTGFGDGARPRYWTHKLRKALTLWMQEKAKSELALSNKIPAALELYLKNNKDGSDSRCKILHNAIEHDKSKTINVEQNQGNELSNYT